MRNVARPNQAKFGLPILWPTILEPTIDGQRMGIYSLTTKFFATKQTSTKLSRAANIFTWVALAQNHIHP